MFVMDIYNFYHSYEKFIGNEDKLMKEKKCGEYIFSIIKKKLT